MAMTGTGLAAALLADMDARGVFDGIEDATQRAEARQATIDGLEPFSDVLIQYIVDNAVVKIPQGQDVEGVGGGIIGFTEEEQTGVIE